MPIPSDPNVSWKELVAAALDEAGGQAHLSQINDLIQGHSKTATNPTWRDTIRRVVRQYNIFEPVPPDRSGIYRLAGHSAPPISPTVDLQQGVDEDNHGAIQGALASLGRLYGYDTFIPATDRSSRTFNGVALNRYVTLTSMQQVTIDTATRRRLEQIDVLWTTEDIDGAPWPRYAFEVEHTTGIRSGLERLRNLPLRFNTRMYIIAPGDRERSRFSAYMQEPAYRQMSSALFFAEYDSIREIYELATRHELLRANLGFALSDQRSSSPVT
jgi:hypothetical protein